MERRALILFAHGARDSQWAEPFERLRDLIRSDLREVSVSLAFLEFMTPSLPESVRQLAAAGCEEITVVPVFFGKGGHVLRDLPKMTEQLKKEMPRLKLKVAGAVGESTEVLDALARYCCSTLQKP
ncbi:MAG TPA: CbiX/SirB N-terminal domain-containing protein [Burkholderiaceae bacterium]|nr:CbiX/SirB N-terminal domain-containing protein [Burkholderiaceae bacterium]